MSATAARARGAAQSAPRIALLLAGGTAAVALRSVAGGRAAATSTTAAVVFVVAVLAIAIAAGWRVRRDRHWACAVAFGVGGGALLTVLWLTAGAHLPLAAGRHLGALLVWTPVVASVAVAEEIAIRGALFGALEECAGGIVALLATSLVFGLAHVGLYGWAALPLDVGVGLLLGGLRLLTGGVTAPAVAHVLADLAGGWLG